MDFLKRHERKHVDLVAEVPDLLEADESGPDRRSSKRRWPGSSSYRRSSAALWCCPRQPGQRGSAPVRSPAREASVEERAKLRRYAELFNDRDWDALRALMSEESRLEIVTRARRRGPAAAEYYSRYEAIAPREELRAEVGSVDGRLVLAMFRPASATPSYFVLIEWDGQRVDRIRDFRYVAYITDGADYAPVESTST